METIRLIALLILITFILVSCSENPQKMLSYQEKPFRAHISWQVDSLPFCAIITSYPAANSLTIEFTSPPSVSGITVKKSTDNTTVTLDGIEISAPHLSLFAAISELFSIDGSIKKSFVTKLSGTKLNCAEIVSSSGKEYCLYLYPASGLPRRIVGELYGHPITLDVISFEVIPE